MLRFKNIQIMKSREKEKSHKKSGKEEKPTKKFGKPKKQQH
jgi:hypothetical protein